MEDKRTFGQKMDEFLMKDSTFILLVIGAAAAIFAGTYMYISFGTGAFNDISIVAMLRDGIDTGDYAAAAAFAAGFLIARILEGPLVGLMDIGGSLQTGVGIGLPALFLSMKVSVSAACGRLPFTCFYVRFGSFLYDDIGNLCIIFIRFNQNPVVKICEDFFVTIKECIHRQ